MANTSTLAPAEQAERFLRAYARTHNVRVAAALAGTTYHRMFNRAKRNPEFAERWNALKTEKESGATAAIGSGGSIKAKRQTPPPRENKRTPEAADAAVAAARDHGSMRAAARAAGYSPTAGSFFAWVASDPAFAARLRPHIVGSTSSGRIGVRTSDNRKRLRYAAQRGISSITSLSEATGISFKALANWLSAEPAFAGELADLAMVGRRAEAAAIKPSGPRLYKVVDSSGRSHRGDRTEWIPGEWQPSIRGPLDEDNAYHLAHRDQLLHWLGECIWVAEASDRRIEGPNSLLVGSGRLVREVEGWTPAISRLFSADCAERTLHLLAGTPALDVAGYALEVARAAAGNPRKGRELLAAYGQLVEVGRHPRMAMRGEADMPRSWAMAAVMGAVAPIPGPLAAGNVADCAVSAIVQGVRWSLKDAGIDARSALPSIAAAEAAERQWQLARLIELVPELDE